MKKTVLFLLILIMSMCPSYAETMSVSGVSTMPELMASINNASIIGMVDGYYTIYEPMHITTNLFTLSENTKIDTYAFIDFNSNVNAYDCVLRGFESGNKLRQDPAYIESGYVIIRENLSMTNMNLRGLGSEYQAARYNDGVQIYGNSSITNTAFEYVKRVTMISEKTPLWAYRNTTNYFNNNMFYHTDAVVYDSINVSFTDCVFEQSKVRAHNKNNQNDTHGVWIESCTFTDANDRPDGDGHYSGVYGYWANMFIANSSFNQCDIKSGDRKAIVYNCTLTDGSIILNSARASSIAYSTLRNGSIMVSRSGVETQIHHNNISGDFYGIRIGTDAKYGTTLISYMGVHDNLVENTTHGIAILNAYGTVQKAKIHNNTVRNSTVSLYTHGYLKHSMHQNLVYSNTFDSDVIVSGAVYSFYNNHIAKTLFISDPIGYITIINNTAEYANITNTINTTFDSCEIGIYNFADNSNMCTILSNSEVNITADSTVSNVRVMNTTYVLNGSIHLSSDNMNYTVHRGNLSETNTRGLNGTYDLKKESVVIIENIESINNSVTFTGHFGIGNYSISKHGETDPEMGEHYKRNAHKHGRNDVVPVACIYENRTTAKAPQIKITVNITQIEYDGNGRIVLTAEIASICGVWNTSSQNIIELI